MIAGVLVRAAGGGVGVITGFIGLGVDGSGNKFIGSSMLGSRGWCMLCAIILLPYLSGSA